MPPGVEASGCACRGWRIACDVWCGRVGDKRTVRQQSGSKVQRCQNMSTTRAATFKVPENNGNKTEQINLLCATAARCNEKGRVTERSIETLQCSSSQASMPRSVPFYKARPPRCGHQVCAGGLLQTPAEPSCTGSSMRQKVDQWWQCLSPPSAQMGTGHV